MTSFSPSAPTASAHPPAPLLLGACLAICLSLCAALPQPAHAASKKSNTGDTTASANSKSTASKKKPSVRITHQRSPSEETTTARDRRLYRECRGMPNAGACLGYTGR